MSIGLAIFLSALIFGVILLFWITRDSWDWGRGARWAAIGVGSIMVIVGVGRLGYWGYQKYESLPRRQTTYADLTLGMTMNEVKYANGKPTLVANWNPLDIIAVEKLTDKQHIEDFQYWIYAATPDHFSDGDKVVHFNPRTKLVDGIRCASEDFDECPSIFQIHDGSTEGDVLQQLGNPTRQSIDGDGYKHLHYDNLGVAFRLARKKVDLLEVDTEDRVKVAH